MDVLSDVIAAVAFVVALLTYLGNTDKAQRKNAQLAALRVLAARAIVLWKRCELFVVAQRNHDEVDTYQMRAAKSDAAGLLEALDKVIGLGLLQEILSDNEYGSSLYASFAASLAYQANLSLDAPIEEWTKLHLIMGMVRLLDVLLKWRPSVLPESVRNDINAVVVGMRDEAWTYASSIKAMQEQDSEAPKPTD